MKFSRYNMQLARAAGMLPSNISTYEVRSDITEIVFLRSRNATLQVSYSFNKSTTSGDGEIRTLDPLLARQVLSQLSYTPTKFGSHLLSHAVSSIVSSAA